MKQLLFLFVITLLALQVRSQVASPTKIIGRVRDNDLFVFLSGASVTCLRTQDSTRVAITHTDKNGSFVINDILPGNYLLNLTYLGYKNLVYPIKVELKQDSLSVGVLALERVGLNLSQFEVKGIKKQVRVKRDTLEYSADNFRTKENSLVEELFKKIPGIEVGDDGSIKINGEVVKQILIDGHPFFADNPTLITKNILSELIDKIQVIDRKKAQLLSQEVNGERKEKIINITIRKDKADIVSGQLSSSYALKNKFSMKTMASRFRANQQMAFFISGDNINGYQEGRIEGSEGFVRSWNAGVNYSEDINSKLKVYGNYIIENSKKDYEKKSTRQNFISDSNYYNQQSKISYYSTNHRINTKVEYKIDSLQTLSYSILFNYKTNTDTQGNYFQLSDKQTKILNSGLANNSMVGNGSNFYNSLMFEKKFRKDGRLLNIEIAYGNSNIKGDNYNLSRSQYTLNSGESISDTINQKRVLSSVNQFTQLSFTYAEPVMKNHSLVFSYVYTRHNSPSNNPVFDYDEYKGKYNLFNDSLSNTIENKSFYHYGGISLSTSNKKYDYTFSLFTYIGDMNNNNASHNIDAKLRNLDFLPNISFNYYFAPNKQFNFSYLISSQLPDISQIQPVIYNSNPLFIQLGNKDLKPAHNHSISFRYSSINVENLKSLSVVMNGEFLSNKIVNATWTDTLARQINQPLNKNGAYIIQLSVDNSYPLKTKGNTINFTSLISLNRDINYWNGKDGSSTTISTMQSISLNYTYKEIFDLSTSATFNYNNLKYSNKGQNNLTFLNYRFSLDCNVNVPWSITVGGKIKYNLNTGRSSGYNTNAVIINAYIAKPLTSNRQLVLKLHGYDLLNKNVFNTRTIGEGYVEDIQSIGLQRFFMIQLTYTFKNKSTK